MKIQSFTSIADVVSFCRDLDDEDFSYYVIKATTQETKELLKKEVLNWPLEKLEGLEKMFGNYFSVSVPLEYLREMVADNLDLAVEVDMGYETDPWVRSISFIAFTIKTQVHKSITVDEAWNISYRALNYPDAYLSESEEMKNNPVIICFKQKMNEIGAKILTQ